MIPSVSAGAAVRRGASPLARVVSLRTELLFNLALLATAAMLLVVVTVLVFGTMLADSDAAAWLTALIMADVAVFILFGGYIIRRQILHPIEDVVMTADAIARGDLSRRVARGRNVEFERLADSINSMTERLLEERSQVVRAEKMASVGRLAAGVAHEVGNPLGAINGYTYLLRQRLTDDAAKEVVTAIEREAARIDRIVHGLLDYARERRPVRGTLDVSDTVRSVADLLRAQGVFTHTTVGLTLATDLPSLAGDRHEMEQALVNLFLNAVDAMPGGGVLNVVTRRTTLADLLTEKQQRAGDPQIVVVPRKPDPRLQVWLKAAGYPAEMIEVVVADSGPGVSEADRERIFDPFFTTKEPGKGTGLGLAIVARLVDELGGAIWVRRAREGGAAFVLLFPIVPADTPPGPGAAPLERSSALITAAV